jgi:hypothetical protein
MSKFGLWRVCPIWWLFADLIVSVPSQGSSRGNTRCKQGELVGSKAARRRRGGGRGRDTDWDRDWRRGQAKAEVFTSLENYTTTHLYDT